MKKSQGYHIPLTATLVIIASMPTLIFYGFPEKPHETWDDCIQILEEHIEACGFEERVQTDQAHRSIRRNDAKNQTDPRPIIAEFVARFQRPGRELHFNISMV